VKDRHDKAETGIPNGNEDGAMGIRQVRIMERLMNCKAFFLLAIVENIV
jgi:hypothetical protein